MTPKRHDGHSCEEALRRMDRYAGGDARYEEVASAREHVKACSLCTDELARREHLRLRLKSAVASESASPLLEQRIRRSLREEAPPRKRSTPWMWAPRLSLAALAILLIAVTVAYQVGHLRFTVASQEAFVQSISGRVASIMRVGLQDHVHCAVFRKTPKKAPTFEEVVKDVEPEYRGLVDLVKQHVPDDYKIIMAHHCRYHGRKFVHFTMKSDSNLISLVISRKGQGETFERDLAPALAESGIPIYQSGVQRFQIAGFESRDHLAYVVSDLNQQGNLQLMARLAPTVKNFLENLES
jgi:hypothetical protein